MHQFIEQIYKLETCQDKTVIFLDRDGTLIKDVNYLYTTDQIELLPGVIEGLKLLQKYNVVFIVITNQPVIAKGLATVGEVKKINDSLVDFLQKYDIIIHAIYSCPHHPNANVAEYRMDCLCRKPNTAMFEKAIKTFFINGDKTAMIGDSFRDINAAKHLAIPAYFIQGEMISNDHFISKDFLSTAQMIID